LAQAFNDSCIEIAALRTDTLKSQWLLSLAAA